MASSDIFTVEPVTGTIVCIPCSIGVSPGKGLAVHLKKKHGEMDGAISEEAVAKAMRAREKVLEEENDMREAYLEAPVLWRGGRKRSPLSALVGLPVLEGYECTKCTHCFKVAKNIGEHGMKEHGVGEEAVEEFVKEVRSKGTVGMQTLLQGAKLRYFRVMRGGGGVGTVDRPSEGSGSWEREDVDCEEEEAGIVEEEGDWMEEEG